MAALRLLFLGPPLVEMNGDAVSTDRRKAIALLAYLAVSARAHTREALAALFWPEYDSARAYAYLRRTLWEINDSLGKGWLDVDREEVSLSSKADAWLDVAHFRTLLAGLQGHGHPPNAVCEACREPLEAAAGLYRGDFLEGFSLRDSAPFDDWQRYVAEGLRLALGDLLPRLVVARGQAREIDGALAAARRWLGQDTLNEEAHRQLMLLYALNGQLSLALHQFDECVRLLQEELGLPPERKTSELAGRIRRREITPVRPSDAIAREAFAGIATATPAAATPEARPFPLHNLPLQLTPFVGRMAELDELDGLLADPPVRLLSILAVGGMGKTRLVIEVANRALERMPHGVVYIPLASLQSPASVIPTLAEALNLPLRESTAQRESVPQKEQVLGYLREKSLLLVLDNFEHLLEAAPLAHEILQAAPQVKILVTSRVPLGLQGEHRYHLAGMDFPSWETPRDAPDYGAVKLFVQGARRARPDFRLGQGDLTAVVRICRLVEGMPLAILLAAGWTEMLSPAEIAVEIERSLDFLETTLQDIPERHRSLRYVLDHAWNLLSEGEQRAFAHLSVIRGSFSRQAAQAVSGASLRELMSLVNKSLLQRMPDGNFSMHELLRQQAEVKLAGHPDEFQAARDRHSAWFCRRLAKGLSAMKGGQTPEPAGALDQDVEDIRLAWSWAAISGHTERLAETLEPLGLLYFLRWRYQEGRLACEFAADALDPADPEQRMLYGHILAWQAAFSMSGEHVEDCTPLIERSLALLEQPGVEETPAALRARAFAYNIRGQLATWVHREPAEAYLQRSLSLFRQAGDLWWSAEVLQVMGFSAWVQDDLERTADYFQQSLEIRRALGDQVGLAGLLNNLASLAGFDRGRVDEAVRQFGEAADLYQKLGGATGRILALSQRQAAARLAGNFEEALDLIRLQIAAARELGDKGQEVSIRMVMGEVLTLLGHYQAARDELQAVVAIRQSPILSDDEAWARWALAAALLGLGQHEEVLHLLQPCREQREGQVDIQGGWTLFGRILALVSRAELGLGHVDEAWDLVRRALSLLAGQHYFWLIEAMAAAAAALAVRGQAEEAVAVYALLDRHPAVANSRWFGDVFGRLVAEAAQSLPGETREQAQARGRSGDLWQAAQALLSQ